jgi:hypothetical protein
MQKPLLILLLLACFAAFPALAQPDSHPPLNPAPRSHPPQTAMPPTPASPLVTRLISLYKKLERFDIRYRDFHEDKYADSVSKYNTRFSKLITSPGMTHLTPADWRRLTTSTGLTVTSSGDGQLQILSWLLENPSPTPPYCSNVVFAGDRKPLPISIYGGGEDDQGDNVTTDTIINIRLHGQPYYLVYGSNKCGTLCEAQVASLYSLSDKEIIRCDSAFYDDSVYSSEVSFSYSFVDELKFTPAFKLEGNVLVSPVFDEDDYHFIGLKRYRLMPNAPSTPSHAPF